MIATRQHLQASDLLISHYDSYKGVVAYIRVMQGSTIRLDEYVAFNG